MENEASRLVRLAKENRERIAESRLLVAEMAECIRCSREAMQARRDSLNPKIIPLPKPNSSKALGKNSKTKKRLTD